MHSSLRSRARSSHPTARASTPTRSALRAAGWSWCPRLHSASPDRGLGHRHVVTTAQAAEPVGAATLSRVSGPPRARRLADLSGTSPDRLAGISDGIFAVGMTLLVLGLGVGALSGSATTELQLWDELRSLGPNVLVYTMSFMTLGIFWLRQGTQMNHLARSNRHYVWIHLVFLFAVTLVPFSTLLLAHFYWLKVALLVYWLNILLLGAALLAALEYGLHAHLFGEEGKGEMSVLMRGRILIAQLLYAAATAL